MDEVADFLFYYFVFFVLFPSWSLHFTVPTTITPHLIFFPLIFPSLWTKLKVSNPHIPRPRTNEFIRLNHWYFYHCSSDDASSNWSDSCYAYPSPEEERPPPPYPSSSSSSSSSSSCSSYSLPHHHFRTRTPPGMRPVAPSPESVPPGPSPPPRRTGYSPPPLPHSLCPSPQQLDINSNPKPNSLHLPKPASPSIAPHGPPSETNGSSLYIKPPLVLTRHDLFLGSPKTPSTPLPAPPPWAACACSRERGAKLTR